MTRSSTPDSVSDATKRVSKAAARTTRPDSVPDAKVGPSSATATLTRGASVPEAKVGLSSASVYPETTHDAFEIAAGLGYDGLELMVWTDPVSQDVNAIKDLREQHQIPILAVHAPCLLITQRVWSPDPWERLTRAVEAAVELDARTVVVHPPFRWQKEYGREFVTRVAELEDSSGVMLAVENMYPWRAAGRELAAYLPDWDPTDEDYAHCTLDLSHTAVSGSDAMRMATDLGDRLAHLHLTDGTGSVRDEHLIPGRGTQPCAEILEHLATKDWTGTVILEVSTRKSRTRADRELELAEALAFARLYLAAPATSQPGPAGAQLRRSTIAVFDADADADADAASADDAMEAVWADDSSGQSAPEPVPAVEDVEPTPRRRRGRTATGRAAGRTVGRTTGRTAPRRPVRPSRRKPRGSAEGEQS